MKTLADENIPLAEELFGSLGEVTLVKGREVDEHFPGLATYDVLAIRSVTDVTPALVDAARRARVIGTATIGTDHIDTAYIEEANAARENPIKVFSAPGSNADSVADYVWFALAHVAGVRGTRLHGRSLGIVGCGNCGSCVARRAEGFGVEVLRNDPPRAERETGFDSVALEEVLRADFVTLHVPLTEQGESEWPTRGMIGPADLAMIRPEAVLINSSRGTVVHSDALADALRAGTIGGAVLDVFEGEPEPDEALIELPLLATPHIAGYAVEGKRRGAIVIYEQTCCALGIEPMDTSGMLTGEWNPPREEAVRISTEGGTPFAADRAVQALLKAVYDIEATSRRLKASLETPRRGEAFDRMRRDYNRHAARHELAVYRVRLDDSLPEGLQTAVRRRVEGFGVAITDEEAHYVLSATR